jgi:hypothetical protein
MRALFLTGEFPPMQGGVGDRKTKSDTGIA